MVSYDLLIGGEHRETSDRLRVENPATGGEVGHVARGDATDATDAIEAAHSVRRGGHGVRPPNARPPFSAVADRIEDEADDIAELLTLETGKCLATAEGEVAETAAQFRFYAGVADKVRGDTIPTSSNRLNYTRRVPLRRDGPRRPVELPAVARDPRLRQRAGDRGIRSSRNRRARPPDDDVDR